MISINLSERSTWRGAVRIVAGSIGLCLLVPVVIEIANATSPEQIKFALTKATAFASAPGLVGETISGIIGFLFSDK